MNKEERNARVAELWAVVDKAEGELARLGSHRSLTREVEAALAELKAGDDPKSQGIELGNLTVAALNALIEHLAGEVSVRGSNDVTVSTDVGDLHYDGDEWHFLEQP
ncbi:hypothetical protein ACFW2V_12725 [Streptomyces sp. NPDC058947]|uniref:hypothetical protein n=1 Tax=Streptomyces sp. NPDC058947 TaxID=3346675 RepID=UPI0036D19C56